MNWVNSLVVFLSGLSIKNELIHNWFDSIFDRNLLFLAK